MQRALWTAHLVAEALLVGAICYRGLLRRYPLFALFLTADLVGGLVLAFVPYRTLTYTHCFRIYQAVLLGTRVGAAAELYERIIDHFRTTRRTKFGLAGIILSISVFAAWALFRPALDGQTNWPQTAIILAQRFESTALCLVLLLTRYTLFRFLNIRPELRSNVRLHWSLLTIYFAISGAASAAVILLGQGNRVFIVGCAMLAADMICFALWMRGMQPEGEFPTRRRPLTPSERAYRESVKKAVIREVERLAGRR